MICVPIVILLFILHMLYMVFDIPTDVAIIHQAKSFLTLDQILIFVLFVGASITIILMVIWQEKIISFLIMEK